MEHIKYPSVERVSYIQEMLAELRMMAQAERCETLTYFIEMAYLEAEQLCGQRRLRVVALSDKLQSSLT